MFQAILPVLHYWDTIALVFDINYVFIVQDSQVVLPYFLYIPAASDSSDLNSKVNIMTSKVEVKVAPFIWSVLMGSVWCSRTYLRCLNGWCFLSKEEKNVDLEWEVSGL